MGTIEVIGGGKAVLMSGHARQKKWGDKHGSLERASKRARTWSVRGYVRPTGVYLMKQQLKLMRAAVAQRDKHKTYEDFMDAVLPGLKGKVIPDAVVATRKATRIATVNDRIDEYELLVGA